MTNKLVRRDQSYAPLWGLASLHRDLDSFFGDIWGTSARAEAFQYHPSCDVEESENAFHVTFDLPGLRRDDINIEVKNNQLFISGERKDEINRNEGRRHLSERFVGSFSRSFTLPSQVDSNNIQAKYSEGVLSVSIPKTEEAKPRKVKID